MSILRTASPGARGPNLLDTRGWLRSVWRAGPERWIWPVSLIAWVVLAWGAIGWYPLGLRLGDSMSHHQVIGSAPPAASEVRSSFSVAFAAHLLLWVVMIAATMLPLIARNLRTVGLRSPRPRRTAATLEVSAGWAIVWVAAGAAVAAALALPASAGARWATVAFVCGAGVAWQFTRVRTSALTRCHRAIAPPLGAGATSACVRFGSSLGWACVLGCWPSMVLMAVSGHNLVVVGALAWLSWRDVRLPHNRPARWTSAAVLAGVGAFVLFLQL